MVRSSPARANLIAGASIAAAVSAGLVLARLLASGNALDRMWAEDGKIFLGRADDLSSLTETYAGYAHTLPRVLALVGRAVLPVASWAPYAVVTSCLVVGALAAFVFLAAHELTGSTASAVVAAASLALAPALRFETLGSLANLQWFLLPAALWALLLPPGRMRWTAACVAGTAALSTPLVALLLPAALAVQRRDVIRAWPVYAVVGGCAVQLLLIAVGPADDGGPDRLRGIPPDAGSALIAHVGGTAAGAPALTWAGLAAASVVLGVGCWRADGLRVELTAALGSGLLLLGTTAWLTGEMASRFVAGASLLVFVGLAISVGASRWALPGLAVIAAVSVVAFPAHAIKVSGPSWAEGVAAWSAACEGGAPRADIPVGPAGWGAATVDCPTRD